MMNSSRRFSTLAVMTPSTLSFFATFLMFFSLTLVAPSSSAAAFHLSTVTTVCDFFRNFTNDFWIASASSPSNSSTTNRLRSAFAIPLPRRQ
jgi:hypothetical protein